MSKTLTVRQKEVLHLLTTEAMPQAEISRRLKISEAAVSQHVKALKKKGYLKKAQDKTLSTGVPHKVSKNLIRLHGEEYKVGIISSNEKYARTRTRCTSVLVNGDRVVFYRDSLVIFVLQSFYGESVEEVDAASTEHIYLLLRKLERLYGVFLLKERKENVKRVKAHYAETNNELAEDFRKKKESCRVFGTVDGKEWLLFDDSHPDGFGLSEAETTHSPTARDSRSAREDMAGVIRPLMNDYRDNRPSLPSVREQAILTSLEANKVIQRQMEAITSSVSAMASLMKADLEARSVREPQELPKDVKKPDYFG